MRKRIYNYLDLVEFGVKRIRPGYGFMRIFAPSQFGGTLSSKDLAEVPDERLYDEHMLMKKFWKLYPELKYMPVSGPIVTEFGGQMHFSHPATHYINKTKMYMKQGYNQYKAFQMVGKELEEILQKQADETRIIRGVALKKDAYTYLERVQEVAEAESQMKMKRLERDMPKFLRAQRNYIKQFEDEQNKINELAAKSLGMTTQQFLAENNDKPQEQFEYEPEKIENMMKKIYDFHSEDRFEKYQPVLYQIIKDPQDLYDKESQVEVHEKFLERTENILKIHHQRSHIHDGLKHLTDNQLIQKMKEAPTKLKKHSKQFLKKIQKYGAKLDNDGELNLSDVKDKNVQKYLLTNQSIVKLTLMQADLEFEYPQKLEKIKAKANVLEMANKEEEKLQFAEFAKEADEARKKILTYEEYFQIDPKLDGHVMQKKRMAGKGQSLKDGVTYEEFLQQNQSDNIFQNDLLDLQYKFWESQEDKEIRLKQLWIDLTRKKALSRAGDEQLTKEQFELNNKIVEMIRRLRLRVDQQLAGKHIEPLFKESYYSYSKDEFMLDADFEFYKVKNFLNKSPRILKEDPIVGVEYLKVINLIKQKKLLENTSDQYDPTASIEAHYFDIEKEEILQQQLEDKSKEIQLGQMDQSLSQVPASLDDFDLKVNNQVMNEKKNQAKEQLKIIKQFENLAETIKKKPTMSDMDVKIETAGQIKKRERQKVKSEKTLGAKLRLKAKKTK